MTEVLLQLPLFIKALPPTSISVAPTWLRYKC